MQCHYEVSPEVQRTSEDLVFVIHSNSAFASSTDLASAISLELQPAASSMSKVKGLAEAGAVAPLLGAVRLKP